jgi:putative transcriptional regulator
MEYDGNCSLTGQLLIAMPGMLDPNFDNSVTYICEHSDKGALGLVINRPLDLSIRDVLDQLSLSGDLRTQTSDIVNQPVLRGGPVQAERGFVIHDAAGDWDSTTRIAHSICVTTSQDILSAIAAGKGPGRLLLALGYAGWGAGQLEEEIRQNAWLTAPATPELVFSTPFDQRWEASAAGIGIDLASLSTQAGHA